MKRHCNEGQYTNMILPTYSQLIKNFFTAYSGCARQIPHDIVLISFMSNALTRVKNNRCPAANTGSGERHNINHAVLAIHLLFLDLRSLHERTFIRTNDVFPFA